MKTNGLSAILFSVALAATGRGDSTLQAADIKIWSLQTSPTLFALGTGIGDVLVLQSADLKNWEPLVNISSKVSSSWFVEQSTGEIKPQKFYRAVTPQQSVDEKLKLWRGLGYSAYKYKLTRRCFCYPITLSGIVTVRNGNVVAVTFPPPIEGVSQPTNQFKSIEQLFEIVQQETAKVDVLIVGYDQARSFPFLIKIDPDIGIADDEITYEASDVEPIE